MKTSNSSFIKKIFTYLKQLSIRHSKWIFIIIVSIALADLTLLFLWPRFIPDSDMLTTPSQQQKKVAPPPSSTSIASSHYIRSTNIFHRGPIPDSIQSEDEVAVVGTSQLSSLPLTLLGTVESSNPQLSMASILHNKDSTSQSYFVGETIESIARITSIERKKVIFLNLTNNRMEHIEIPFENGMIFTPKDVSFIEQTPIPKQEVDEAPDYEGISKTGSNEFALDRSTINSHLQILPDILQQARVVPKYSPDGGVLGHTFTWIKKGSIFEGLGLKEGDTLLSVNGETVKNTAEASELFQKLRTSSQIHILVENQDGNVNRLSYEVNENESVQ